MKHHTALRKILSLTLSLCLVFGVAAPGLAATYEVSDAQQMSDSWTAANSNSDSSNTFNMTQNIDMDGVVLSASDNKEYVIQSKNDADYTISNVHIVAGGSGGTDPKIEIHADVTDGGKANSDAALMVSGGMEVSVFGDVSVKTEGGDVTAAISAENQSEVYVLGDVTSAENGVVAIFDSSVAVTGDLVTQSKGEYRDGYDGVSLAARSDLTVHGKVDIADGMTIANESIGAFRSDVTVQRNIDVSDHSYFTILGDEGSVDVQGELNVGNHATVTVPGDVKTSLGVSVTGHSQLDVEGDLETSTMNAIGYAEVNIGGDAKALGNEVRPDEFFAEENSKVTVNGNITAGQVSSQGNSTMEAGSIEATYYINAGMWVPENDPDPAYDGATLTVHGDAKGRLDAQSDARITVEGNLDGDVVAKNNAVVQIWDDISGGTTVSDNAVVQEHTRPGAYNSNITHHNSMSNGDTLTELCLNYGQNSEMKKHLDDLRDVLISASSGLVPYIDDESATVIAILEMFDIAAAELEEAINPHDYDWDSIHPSTEERFFETENINAYMVECHRKTLANALESLSNNAAGTEAMETSKGVITAAQKAYQCLTEADKADMSDEEREFFEKALENDVFSEEEAREYLLEFGGYVSGEKGIGKATKDLKNMVDSVKTVGVAMKAVDVTISFMDFLTFYNKNYTNQVAVLDEMLMNTPMEPEMLIAVYELRETFADKFAGEMDLLDDKIRDYAVGEVKDLVMSANPVLKIADVALELLDATGAFDEDHVVNDTASLLCTTPSALDAYEQAILRVRGGDTSEEALELVKLTYAVVQNSLSKLCESMVHLGNEKEQERFSQLKQKVDSMQPGDLLPVEILDTMTAENFAEFYKSNINPDAKYSYA